ncbi:MAG TPA: 30S ribosomal protein S8 [Polyangiaceae bacterium LLY-WYZ-15_(1-7)]|nr:30S ribosomal protein S8 [Sandaracinus sp.]HJK94314.1 30S ribosomal protein S8 [Polyangiaceae bacterium LLY-WYZ-15_(1-7)]MBJ74683.1 30S ribosomal protein S8 [Sandaracinus sp.]HJL00134.1 30S ribosomal protein S8 [Polyangiaceae bacterium LLY-WYZ-15_(1-7)]HJL08882.1 30S ribosomal protein S8 [Polyangiaceae bacterium LLY-WYZ-15_(1-7)]
MMTDPIADMLTRLRNASLARLDRAEMPLSKLKLNIAKILKEEGYVNDYEVGDRHLTVFLKYGRDRRCAFEGLKRASRPGRRFYVGRESIPKVHNGLGVAILSTSHGVMTDKSAREKGVGGEVICEVW